MVLRLKWIFKFYNMRFLYFTLFIFTLQTLCFAQVNTTQWNPSYHFYPSGDPTGLYYFDGKYFNNWGSASSTDFINWEYTQQGINNFEGRKMLNDPTTTEKQQDSIRNNMVRLGGSGSIVIDHKNSSGLGKNGQPPLVSFWHNEIQPFRVQGIGLAYSTDSATTWHRYEKYPVVDINSREFRDPKVFWHEETEKWIMAIGWAEVSKIMFFNSDNLIDWELMSEFGPWGATNGVWECVDLFPVAVDDESANTKWVLVISVQPFGGQYFIGDFDGRRFTMDSNYVKLYKKLYKKNKYTSEGEVIFNFEHGIDDWQMSGDAFVQSPSTISLYRQGAIMGIEGKYFINSFHNEMNSTGRVLSPEFVVTKDYLNFKIGGGYAPGKECVNLIIKDQIVRTETGRNSNNLQWASWNVTEFKGETARIEIVDDMVNGYGCIYADHFILSDEEAKTNDLKESLWIDYGPDFFAVRAWNNYAPQEKRNIWTAWMSSWRYTGEEPVGRVQTLPREVKLKTFPEGIRLIQQPVVEIKSLRTNHYYSDSSIINHTKQVSSFKPERNVYELIVEFENIDANEFGINVCVGNNQKTVIGYNTLAENVYVDRRESGNDEFSAIFPKINYGPLKNRDNRFKFHLFIDNCSIEVFANDGETTLTSKIYPDPSSLGIEFFSSEGSTKLVSANLYELKDIDLHKDF